MIKYMIKYIYKSTEKDVSCLPTIAAHSGLQTLEKNKWIREEK